MYICVYKYIYIYTHIHTHRHAQRQTHTRTPPDLSLSMESNKRFFFAVFDSASLLVTLLASRYERYTSWSKDSFVCET